VSSTKYDKQRSSPLAVLRLDVCNCYLSYSDFGRFRRGWKRGERGGWLARE